MTPAPERRGKKEVSRMMTLLFAWKKFPDDGTGWGNPRKPVMLSCGNRDKSLGKQDDWSLYTEDIYRRVSLNVW